MARRTALLFLAVVCAIGLGLRVGGEEKQQQGPVADQPGSSGDTPAPPPSLTTVKPPAAPAPAPRGDAGTVPAWLRGRPIGAELRGRLVAWIRADSGNLDALIAVIMERSARGDAHAVFETARHLFTMLRELAGQLEPVLKDRLRGPDASVRRRAALLGATYGLTWGGGGVRRDFDDFERILASTEEPLAIRSLAAGALCWNLAERLDYADAINELLRELAKSPNFELLLLLRQLERLEQGTRPFVPTLLEIRPRLAGLKGSDELILQFIAHTDPMNPDAKDLFVRGLAHPKAAVRALARIVLAERDGQDPVGVFDSASAAERVEGAKLLLGRSVARDRLGRDRIAKLLLSALAQGDAGVRDRAIELLPRVSPQARLALPVIHDLLASDDRARWISGAKALSTLPARRRERDDLVRMLVVAARLPDSEVRILAVQSLMQYDSHVETVVPVLAALLRDTDVEVRRIAVDGLGEMSSLNAAAEVHLQGALGDSDASVRELASTWLGQD